MIVPTEAFDKLYYELNQLDPVVERADVYSLNEFEWDACLGRICHLTAYHNLMDYLELREPTRNWLEFLYHAHPRCSVDIHSNSAIGRMLRRIYEHEPEIKWAWDWELMDDYRYYSLEEWVYVDIRDRYNWQCIEEPTRWCTIMTPEGEEVWVPRVEINEYDDGRPFRPRGRRRSIY